MRSKSHLILVVVLFITTVTALASVPAGFASGPTPPSAEGPHLSPPKPSSHAAYQAGHILVKFAPDLKANGQTLLHDLAVEPLDYLDGLDVYVVGVTPGTELSNAARLSALPFVTYAEPDYFLYAFTTPDDPYYADYQWNLPHINADDAWNSTTGSSSVVIAVVDTGVDLTHPDLASKIISGYDFVNDDSDPGDDEGHGTHVASIAAAASNNGEGVAGVSWGAEIMPVKVLGADGSGAVSDIADGIRWAADHGADIINLSLGGSSGSSTLQDAVDYAYNAGVLLVAAAGNEYDEGNPTSYPAAYDHVLAVAATDDGDHHASYSNSGSYVDVAAPGGDPSSSYDSNPDHWIIGAYWRGSGYDYAWLAGTSQATPQVVGLAALLLSVDNTLTNDEMETLIRDTAVDVETSGWDAFTGDGRIDVAAAVAAASTSPTTTPTHTPTVSFSPTWTNTPVPGATSTSTATATQPPTTTPSPTTTLTNTPTKTSVPGATSTSTFTPSSTPAVTSTPTETAIPGATPTATFTPTASPTPVPTGDIRVNDDAGSAAQRHPVIAVDRLGNARAAWKDWRSGDNTLFSAPRPVFIKQWGPNVPIPSTRQTSFLGDPAIAIGKQGATVVTWHDDHDGDSDIYASWFAPTSSSWSLPEQVNDDLPAPAQQRNPDVAIGPNGTVYVVWEDNRSGNPDIFWSQREPGSPNWRPSARVHSGAVGVQVQPAVAVGQDDAVYVAWTDLRGSQGAILVAQMPAGSTTWRAPAIVGGSFPPGANPAQPDIAVDGTNTVHVVWEDSRDNSHRVDVYHSSRRPGSSSWSAATRVNDDTGNADQHLPRLAAAPGVLAAVWEDSRLGNPDIFLSWFVLSSSSGWTLNRQVNSDATAAAQTQPDIALDRNDNAYVVWTDERDAITAPDIYFRFIPSYERFRTYLPMTIKAY